MIVRHPEIEVPVASTATDRDLAAADRDQPQQEIGHQREGNGSRSAACFHRFLRRTSPQLDGSGRGPRLEGAASILVNQGQSQGFPELALHLGSSDRG